MFHPLLLLIPLTFVVGCGINRVPKASVKMAPSPPLEDKKEEGRRDINEFSTTPPERFCGKEGYAFLLTEYITPQCIGCHDQGSFTKQPFASSDLDTAWASAISFGRDSWIKSVTSNTFCGDDCDLDRSGEVYQGIAEWLDSPLSCSD